MVLEDDMVKEMYKYGNLYEKYDMDGDIRVGTGILRVHDIFNPTPEFMKDADVVFSDPPCSLSNINSFYSKADLKERQENYQDFYNRFWEVIDEINPRYLFLEVFKSNKNGFIEACSKRFSCVRIYDSMYYNKPSNKCWIIQASHESLQDLSPVDGMDEEKVIEYICKNTEYNCIADPCMGKGLVGFYANKYGRRFVGTELNKYRLAVCVERITTGKRGSIN